MTPSDAAAADADHRPQLDALLVAEVEDALQQAARDAGLVRALGQADALRHLDDAEGGDLGRPAVRDARADADEVARRARVGERQEDPVRLAPARGHQRPPDSARIAVQRVTRYGLSSSNSRACSSMTRSAWSVVISSVSADEAGGAAEVERRQRGEEPLAIRAPAVERDERVVEAADPQLGREVEARRVLGQLEVHDALELLVGEHLLPRLALGEARLLEVVDQLGVVDARSPPAP